jgi:hypothetical protein
MAVTGESGSILTGDIVHKKEEDGSEPPSSSFLFSLISGF